MCSSVIFIFKIFAVAHVDNLTPPLWSCLLFSKTTERIATGLEIVVRTRHQRTVHHGTLCITLFVIISNLVVLSPVALMISGKLIWLTCQIRKCSITVTRSCWLSLKSFKSLHGLSRWRTKLAIILSKPLQKFWAEAAEDVVFVLGPWSRVRQQTFSTLP